MDFGDILNQWNEQQKSQAKKAKTPQTQVSHKKANAPTKEEKELAKAGCKMTPEELMEKQAKTAINPMELWLRRYGITDKDKLAEVAKGLPKDNVDDHPYNFRKYFTYNV